MADDNKSDVESVKLDGPLVRKIRRIAKEQRRSIKATMEMLLIQAITQQESQNGR